jgi:hypothetical protein
MAALIGLTTGFGEVLVAVLGGIILGGLVAIFLLVTGIKKKKKLCPSVHFSLWLPLLPFCGY